MIRKTTSQNRPTSLQTTAELFSELSHMARLAIQAVEKLPLQQGCPEIKSLKCFQGTADYGATIFHGLVTETEPSGTDLFDQQPPQAGSLRQVFIETSRLALIASRHLANLNEGFNRPEMQDYCRDFWRLSVTLNKRAKSIGKQI